MLHEWVKDKTAVITRRISDTCELFCKDCVYGKMFLRYAIEAVGIGAAPDWKVDGLSESSETGALEGAAAAAKSKHPELFTLNSEGLRVITEKVLVAVPDALNCSDGKGTINASVCTSMVDIARCAEAYLRVACKWPNEVGAATEDKTLVPNYFQRRYGAPMKRACVYLDVTVTSARQEMLDNGVRSLFKSEQNRAEKIIVTMMAALSDDAGALVRQTAKLAAAIDLEKWANEFMTSKKIQVNREKDLFNKLCCPEASKVKELWKQIDIIRQIWQSTATAIEPAGIQELAAECKFTFPEDVMTEFAMIEQYVSNVMYMQSISKPLDKKKNGDGVSRREMIEAANAKSNSMMLPEASASICEAFESK